MATKTVLHFRTRNNICEETRESMVELLNRQLGDTFDLYSQIKQAHWNVKGMNFMQLHQLFDDLAANFIGYADTIAERATAMGGRAKGTARMAAANSRLEELPLEMSDGKDFVIALANRFAEYAASSGTAIDQSADQNDAVTSDIFTEITREVDKSMYFLESHLQR
jgi:starvation-inducible DNA-binding protein